MGLFEQPAQEVHVLRILIRHPDGRIETSSDLAVATTALAAPDTTVWVDAEAESRESLEALAGLFELHPITLDDFINRDQRPKIEEFDRYVFLVIHTLLAARGDEVETAEIHIVLKPRSLLTVHDRPLDILGRVFDRCRGESRVQQNGPSLSLYLLSDAVVDGFFPVLDSLGDEIDALEDLVVEAPARARMTRIFDMKRVLVQLRKIISPQREVFNALSRRDYPYIDARTAVYFRDVHDHLVRAYEMIDSYRDLVANTLDAYLAVTSNRLGQVMKQLTVIATIFMPLSFLTGFFGMNFTTIPFHRWWLLMLAVMAMASVPVIMLLYFLRRGWLAEDRRITSWVRLRAWLFRHHQ
jgi:magnesium transporter